MFFWLYDYPNEVMAGIITGTFVAFYWIGCILIRPILRLFARTRGSNEIVGYILSCFGVFYGLLVGLIAVAAYQNYTQVETTVQKEATALTALFYDVSAYPDPFGQNLRWLLRDYNRYVIKYAWPLQRKGIIPKGGIARVNAFQQKLLEFEPKTKGEEIIHAEALHQFNVFLEYRTQRLQSVTTNIPAVMWYVVIVGAMVNLAFVWLLDMKFLTQLILGGLLAFFLGTMISLIVALDNPFRGDLSIGTDAFQNVAQIMMEE
ncbi:MAG: DUF4239 domain-containing protein [Planctomycetia bacterium]|nr:DUF4239 domain-containing protein [Planctomycetia bacterium]